MHGSKRSSRDDYLVDSAGGVTRRERRRAAPEQDAGEKRRFERMSISRRARATELDAFGTPGMPFDCTVHNISRGGLGLCAPRMVHSNRALFVEVFGQPNEEPRLFFGVVRQCRYVEAQGYFIGVQFEPIPKTAPVDAWLTNRRRSKSN